MKNIKTILWDFDGVILDSMEVRDFGFREIFKSFSSDKVEQLIKYHRDNGGLSRYVKIRYFYESILNKSISEEAVSKYADLFSEIMRKALVNKDNLIQDSVTFLKNNYKNYNFHIVSGSDQEELRYLCKELELSRYFISIHGSPTPKKELVAMLLNKHDYDIKFTCLIGDSVNDYDAAMYNNIEFYGYNDVSLKNLYSKYIVSFSYLESI